MSAAAWSVEHGMCVRRAGEGARTIVWVHGLGESSVSFEPVVRHAAFARYAHVLVDLPGYGRSAHPGAPESLDALADHLARWLAGSPPALVVGHSMGGVLATLLGERAPVRGIVNIDGNLSRGDCTFSGRAAAYSREDFAARGFAELRDHVWANGATERPQRGYHAAMCFASAPVFWGHARDLVEMSERADLAPRLAALEVPALYIAGVPDGICAHSRALLDEAGARWVGLEPSGHWVYADQLEQFAEVVAEFAATT